MHTIQLEILLRLIKTPGARYRDIRPKYIEGNRFMYHLNKVIEDGYVSKKGINYQLTSSGLEFAGRLSLKEQKIRIQPKIATLIIAQADDGRYLLYQRKNEPFRGKTGFPYGKIHLGETVTGAARRELEEKTGLLGDVVHIGDAYVVTYEGEELISHMLFHAVRAKNLGGNIVENSEIGLCFWESVTSVDSSRFFPGFKEIFEAQKKKTHFFLEVEKYL